MDLNVYAAHIGHIILATNSIDSMTYECHRLLYGGGPSKTWTKKDLAPRLQSLMKKAPNDSDLKNALRDLLGEADAIRDIRNMVAHAWVVVGAEKALDPEKPTRWLLYADGHDPITLHDLAEATRKCIKLSNQISAAIAAVGFEQNGQCR